jgi:hypothetical protein
MCFAVPLYVNAQRRPAKAKTGKICGNPQVRCRTGNVTFQAHEIPFVIPKGGTVIIDSEPFYAVILKTVKLNSDVNCENAISEEERLEIQELFINNKVFALKCSDAGDLYYTNVTNDVNFIAVFADKTLTEADRFLKTVQSTGKFKGANVRKMQAGINGT